MSLVECSKCRLMKPPGFVEGGVCRACRDDPVDHPAHYTAGKVECIDALESALSPEEFRGYLKGCVLKYVWRCRLKGAERQDHMKALWYLNRLIGTDAREGSRDGQ